MKRCWIFYRSQTESWQHTLQGVWADGAYTDKLAAWLDNEFGIRLLVVQRSAAQTGFTRLPRRWVVERTLAWLGRYRRLSKDYAQLLFVSEGLIQLAMIDLSVKRLARYEQA